MRLASRSIRLLGLLLAAGYAACAAAQDRALYFRVDTGYAWAQPSEFRDRGPSGIGFLICANPPCNQPSSIDHLGQSPVYGGGVGWRFSPRLRADLTVSWRKFAVDGIDGFPEKLHADVNSQATMLTGYWDFRHEGVLKPFVGLGIGLARNSMGIITENFLLFPGTISASAGVNTSTAYSFSAGAGYKVCDGVVLEVGYRYIDLGKFQTGTNLILGPINLPYPGAEGKLRTNELTVGLRF